MQQYEALFAREVHTIPSSDQGASSSNSLVPVNNSTDITRPNGFSQPQNNIVVIRGRDKDDTDHSRLGQEPLGGRTCQLIPNWLSRRCKPNGSHCEGGSEECGSQSSVKDISPTVETCAYFSSEDEDDCPTCLEGTLCFK